jgi:hypothetical protein
MGPGVRRDDVGCFPHRTHFLPAATKEINGEGRVFMKIWFAVAVTLLTAHSAFAADVATCTLGADKKTVTVTASNPYTQVMACEVNCHMDIPGGFATVVCAKPVPTGAKDFVMCTDVSKDGHSYTRVKETTVNCPDPAAPPAATKADSKDDDDDAEADALMKKMLKQGQDFLDRQKKK